MVAETSGLPYLPERNGDLFQGKSIVPTVTGGSDIYCIQRRSWALNLPAERIERVFADKYCSGLKLSRVPKIRSLAASRPEA
jgi:hypothetical protein